MCGFTQSKRSTVPSMTISFVVSNMDWLWCAEALAQRRAVAVAVRNGVAAVRRFMAGTSSTKSRFNEDKHGVSFDEAASVFGDPLALTFDDLEHSALERRYLTFGLSTADRLLLVVHTSRGATIRIISSRRMTPRERRHYEQWQEG